MRNTGYYSEMMEVPLRGGIQFEGRVMWPIASFECEDTAYNEEGEPYFVVQEFDLVWDSSTTNYLLLCVTDGDIANRFVACVIPKVVADFLENGLIQFFLGEEYE